LHRTADGSVLAASEVAAHNIYKSTGPSKCDPVLFTSCDVGLHAGVAMNTPQEYLSIKVRIATSALLWYPLVNAKRLDPESED
jgi:hypothetical protein